MGYRSKDCLPLDVFWPHGKLSRCFGSTGSCRDALTAWEAAAMLWPHGKMFYDNLPQCFDRMGSRRGSW